MTNGPINMARLQELAQWGDPETLLKATEMVPAQPIDGTVEPSFAAIMGATDPRTGAQPPKAPGMGAGGPLDAMMMQQLMGQMQPKGQQAPSAPAAAPRQQQPMQFPGMPRATKIPSLADILGGK